VIQAANRPEEFARFLSAQAPVYERVLQELKAGYKASHWMWFIFPQLRGLGDSETSRRYAIVSLEHARRYLAHEVLGARLRHCVAVVLDVHGRTADEIFGAIDSMKFHSCLTLFSLCSPPESIFAQGIDRFFAGQPDLNTLRLLKR
jgi:uncharacterized protein (DUF1810 family)